MAVAAETTTGNRRIIAAQRAVDDFKKESGVSFFDVLFNWPELAQRGTDAVAYFVMGAAATLLFLARLTFSLFGGADGDFDTDIDASDATDTSFTLFSLLSILAFFMGAGWMGLACRIDWNLGGLTSAFAASGFGFAMMLFASTLMYATRRLNREITYDVNTAVGKTGRVYLTIPEKGTGHGQVEVTISGRRKIQRASSTGPAIAAFTDVTVLEAQDDETLVVEPKQ